MSLNNQFTKCILLLSPVLVFFNQNRTFCPWSPKSEASVCEESRKRHSPTKTDVMTINTGSSSPWSMSRPQRPMVRSPKKDLLKTDGRVHSNHSCSRTSDCNSVDLFKEKTISITGRKKTVKLWRALRRQPKHGKGCLATHCNSVSAPLTGPFYGPRNWQEWAGYRT